MRISSHFLARSYNSIPYLTITVYTRALNYGLQHIALACDASIVESNSTKESQVLGRCGFVAVAPQKFLTKFSFWLNMMAIPPKNYDICTHSCSLVPRPRGKKKSGPVSTVRACARIYGIGSVNVSMNGLSHMPRCSTETVYGIGGQAGV